MNVERNNDLIVSEAEFSALQILRRKASELDLESVNLHTDWSLIRFLRARKLNPDAAYTMLANSVAFRQKKNFARLADVNFEEKFARFRQCYIHGMYNLDRQGNPVNLEMIGQCDLFGAMEALSKDEIENYFIHVHERIINVAFPILSELAGRRIDQLTGIMDLKNAVLSKLLFGKPIELLSVILKLDQDHYPELLKQMFIINAPFIFSAVFKIAKGFLDPKTVSKISVESGSNRAKLAEAIDPQNLPPVLGGTFTAPLNSGPGPFQAHVNRSIADRSFFLADRHLEIEWFHVPATTSPRPRSLIPNPTSASSNLQYSMNNTASLHPGSPDFHIQKPLEGLGLLQPQSTSSNIYNDLNNQNPVSVVSNHQNIDVPIQSRLSPSINLASLNETLRGEITTLPSLVHKTEAKTETKF